MKVLSLSDVIIPFVYSPQVRRRFAGVDLIVGCGDLAYYYLEYVYDALDVPLFFVRGNHDRVVEYSGGGQRTAPGGGVDLHRRVYNYRGLLMAGVEGSLRYRPGRFQYSQADMWANVLSLVPGLIANFLRYRRFLDVFVTHAPAAGIHDRPDLPHQGIQAFRWLLRIFQPAYHLHGHVHVYHPETVVNSRFGRTSVINCFGYREIELELGHEWPVVPRRKSLSRWT